MSYRDAARFIGCSPGYLSNVEKLRYAPRELFRRAAEEWLKSVGDPSAAKDVSPRYGPRAAAAPPPGVDPDAWPAIRELLPRLSLIYEAQDIIAHAKRWGWIEGNIETFSDMVRADVDALRKGLRKVAGRD